MICFNLQFLCNTKKKQKKYDHTQAKKSNELLSTAIVVPNCKTNGDFFSAKKMSPCYKVHKKIADQPCYNVIFYLRRTEHKY